MVIFSPSPLCWCSVAVPPTLHVIFILTATPLFLLVAVAIGLEYNAAHSSVGAVVEVGGCRRSSTVCAESRCRIVSSQLSRRQSALRVVLNSHRQSTWSRNVESRVVSELCSR